MLLLPQASVSRKPQGEKTHYQISLGGKEMIIESLLPYSLSSIYKDCSKSGRHFEYKCETKTLFYPFLLLSMAPER